MTEPLVVLWATVLFGGPVVSFVYSLMGHAVSPKVAMGLAGAAVVVFAVCWTPVSLPCHTLDSMALAFAWAGLCVAAGALPNWSFQRSTAMLMLFLLAFPGCFAVALGGPPDLPRTVYSGCGRRVRFEAWGSVSDSGIAAVLLWQPQWTPFEIRLGRHEFKGNEFPSISGQEALEVVSRGRCGIDVWYVGRMVWRAR